MAQRYQILFRGELLTGVDPTQARADAARLLNAGPSQIAQLFSGRQVGIRKDLSAADAARYRLALSRIGLRVHAVALPQSTPAIHHAAIASALPHPSTASHSSFRITYSGEVLPGWQRHAVMQRVAQKLRLDEARMTRLFSGKAAILKKGLSAEAAANYLAEAAQLGMQARMEIEVLTAESVAAPAEPLKRFMESAVKTQLYSPRAPLYGEESRKSAPDDMHTVVDIDLMRSLVEEPIEAPRHEAIAEPMPQVKVWRPPEPTEATAAEVAPTPPVIVGPPQMRELALRSIALHMPASTSPGSAPRRKPALQRLAEIGSLLPRALSRILQ